MSSTLMENSQKDMTISNVIDEYTPLVKKIAHHLCLKLPQVIHVEDLIQAGMIGLIEAIEGFNANKGAAFATYAGIRVRGAMLDEVRRNNWAPRSVHKNARKIKAAMQEIQNETKRTAKDSDVAKKLGISLTEYHQHIQDSSNARLYTLEEVGGNDEFTPLMQGPQNCLIERLVKDDFTAKLDQEINQLPEKEKNVLVLYYKEDLNLRQVGDVLGVSESRISQIHSQAVSRLKGRLANWQ